MKPFLTISFTLFFAICALSQNNSTYLVRDNGMYGFINETGEIVIAPEYLDAFPFIGELAAVKNEKGWFFIDKANNRKTTCFVEIVWPHEDGIALARTNQDTVVYINKSGISFYTEYKAKSEPGYRVWSEGYHAVKQDNLWGLIDSSGNYTIEPQYQKIGDVHEGLFYAEKLPKGEYYEYSDREGNIFKTSVEDSLYKLDPCYTPKYRYDLGSYYNLENQKIFDAPNGYNHFGFSEGWASFTLAESGKWTYVNKKGELFPKTYDDCGDFVNGIARIGIILDNEDEFNWEITDTTTDKCTGETVYMAGEPFDSETRKQNYINKNGELLNHEMYDAAYIFRNGQAVIGKDQKFGTIDLNGKEVIPLLYEKLIPISDSLFAFQKDSLWGFLNYRNQQITKPSYLEYGINGNLILVKKGTKWGVIALNGQLLIKPKYDYITHIDEQNKIIGYYEGQIPPNKWSFEIHNMFYSESPQIKLGYDSFSGKTIWKAKN